MKTEPEILCQPQIIKPLHGLNPRTILGTKWWNTHRQEAYESTDYHCLACGVHKKDAPFHKWLEGHEDYDINFEKHKYSLKRIIPLCHACHNYIHAGRLKILMNNGTIGINRYYRILDRGDSIIKREGLNKDNLIMEVCAGDKSKFFPENNGTWDEWHLVIDGKKYYSKFDNYNDWRLYYS